MRNTARRSEPSTTGETILPRANSQTVSSNEALAELREARQTAERELAAIEGRRERLEALEHDRDTLMEHYAGMVPEALESLSSEERCRVYRLLKLTVALRADGTLEASGVVGGSAPVCDLATLSP